MVSRAGLVCIVLLVAALTLAVFSATCYVNRDIIFDDSFITYRYAKNLAQGSGITFNAGEPPTEGYTNFLLVLYLAPFIRLGLDPLLVTRITSFVALALLAFLVGRFAGKVLQVPRTVRFLVSFLILNQASSPFHCLVGLETVIHTTVLFGSFLFAGKLFESNSPRDAALFGLLSFVSSLLRPEAVLLPVAVAVVYLFRPGPWTSKARPLGTGLAALGIPLALYAAWKLHHFGALLPNSFFLKANSSTLISEIGLRSVSGYLASVTLLLVLVAASLIMRLRTIRAWHAAALLFSVLHAAFFVHADAYMDLGLRFMYPVTPFLIASALPAVAAIYSFTLDIRNKQVATILTVAAAILVSVPISTMVSLRDAYRGESYHDDPDHPSLRELRLAHDLARYPHMKRMSLVVGDAGVIPYYTEARVIDPVGLNDGYIARTRDFDSLLDYVFDQEPTVFILPSMDSKSWFRRGHGLLGDYEKVSRDPRWRDYRYVGTIFTTHYNGEILVRTDHEHSDDFVEFAREQIVDTVHDPFPLVLGRP